MTARHRVVLWGTGNVGRHALAGIDARPDLELVGVWVSNPDKVGRDAGELAGLGRSLGVAATGDAAEVLALRPDCVVHTAMADHRLPEALADLLGGGDPHADQLEVGPGVDAGDGVPADGAGRPGDHPPDRCRCGGHRSAPATRSGSPRSRLGTCRPPSTSRTLPVTNPPAGLLR